MGVAPEWQANYADLCDDRTLSFGAECIVCQARYVSAAVPLSTALPADGPPDAATSRAIQDLKRRVYSEFDQDYRSILLTCARCGMPSCPDCWDVDRQMCGRCVADAGMMRSPPLGGPAQGALAAGTLRRSQAGRYSEVGRPAWLKELLRTQNGAASAADGPGESGGDLRLFFDPVEATYPLVAPLPAQQAGIEPPPTEKMPASAPPGPTLQIPGTGRLVAPEGEATSEIVACPRCNTPNYDFVTQCANCGLQLIQKCASCQHLNPADAQVCQFCEMPLLRPTGWTSVSGAIAPLNSEVGRRRMTQRPAPAETVVARPQVRQRASWSDELDGGGDEERQPAPQRQHRSGGPRRQTRAPAQALLTPEPAPMEIAPVSFAGAAQVHHPYEVSGVAELTPILDDGSRHEAMRQTQQVIGDVVALVERTLVALLLLGLFAVVGVVTAAETSTQANLALLGVLHFDIKAHVDQLLSSLHLLQSPR
jgi:hypothetical protein